MKPRLAVAILAIILASSGIAAPSHAGGKDLTLVPSNGPLAHQTVYTNSYALLVGVNNYPNLPAQLQLHYAVADAQSMREMLIKYYGFPPDHIKMLLNGDATKHNIIDAFSDYADQDNYHTDDRIFVFFSGHGQTVNLPGGGKEGFLIPSDAQVKLNNIDNAAPFLKSCVQMSEVWDYLNSSPAKHILLVADACYSGLLTQNRTLGGLAPGALTALASKRALQVITAGGQGETSSEMDAYGHGAFTYKLLEELKARAQVSGDVFTTSELYAAVERSVANATNGAQDPQFGNYKTEGDFLFITTKPQKVPEMTNVAVVTPPDDDVPHNNFTNNHHTPYVPPAPVNPQPQVKPTPQRHTKYSPEKYQSNVIAIVPFSATFSGVAQQFWQAYPAGLTSEMSAQVQANLQGYSVPNEQQVQQALMRLQVPYSQTGYGYLSLENAQQLAKQVGARYIVMGQFTVDEKLKIGFPNKYDVEITGSGQVLDPDTGDVITKLDGKSKKSTSFFGQATTLDQTNTATANAKCLKEVGDQMVDAIKDALGGGGGTDTDSGNQ